MKAVQPHLTFITLMDEQAICLLLIELNFRFRSLDLFKWHSDPNLYWAKRAAHWRQFQSGVWIKVFVGKIIYSFGCRWWHTIELVCHLLVDRYQNWIRNQIKIKCTLQKTDTLYSGIHVHLDYHNALNN